MKKLISLLVALTFVSNYSISQSEQKDIIKKADLLLDMMEYEAAIVNYLRVLSQDPQQKDVRKKIGYAYFRSEKVDEAVKFLKEELRLFPDNGDAYDLLVHILFKCKMFQEYYDYLESLKLPIEIDSENPNSGLADFILGMYFKQRREFGKARSFFRKALERGHDPVKCYVQLIDIELMRGEFRLASRVLPQEVREKYGWRPEFLFMAALTNFERSRTNNWFLPGAIRGFKAAWESRPDFTDALFNMACINYNIKDFKTAAVYFERILEREPENTKVKFYLDCALRKLSESVKEESISECPKMLHLSKEFVDRPDMEYKYQFSHDVVFVLFSINQLALKFIRKGEMQQAIKRYLNGIKIYPESPEINYNLGMVYFMQNNFEEAEKHALIALRRKEFFTAIPDKLPDYEIRRLIEKKNDPIHEAPETPLSRWTFDTALKEGNYFIEAYDLLGNIYFRKGDFDKSILAFKKDIEIDHEDAWGYYNLGCTYKAIGDWESAEKEWKRAIKYEEELKRREKRREISNDQLDISLIVFKKPISFRAHKSLGWLYLEKKIPNKALKEFQKAIELEPNDPEPYYEIGKIYQAKSEKNEKYVRKAVDCYKRYLYLGGEKEEEVKGFLKSLKYK
jgi:tetratricopeptide (TPR) repeat protein